MGDHFEAAPDAVVLFGHRHRPRESQALRVEEGRVSAGQPEDAGKSGFLGLTLRLFEAGPVGIEHREHHRWIRGVETQAFRDLSRSDPAQQSMTGRRIQDGVVFDSLCEYLDRKREGLFLTFHGS